MSAKFFETMARHVAADEALALSGADSAEAVAARKRLVEFSEMDEQTRGGVLAALAVMRKTGRV